LLSTITRPSDVCLTPTVAAATRVAALAATGAPKPPEEYAELPHAVDTNTIAKVAATATSVVTLPFIRVPFGTSWSGGGGAAETAAPHAGRALL
jgi:hypothetical protein